jgi:hypothetical protein
LLDFHLFLLEAIGVNNLRPFPFQNAFEINVRAFPFGGCNMCAPF